MMNLSSSSITVISSEDYNVPIGLFLCNKAFLGKPVVTVDL